MRKLKGGFPEGTRLYVAERVATNDRRLAWWLDLVSDFRQILGREDLGLGDSHREL